MSTKLQKRLIECDIWASALILGLILPGYFLSGLVALGGVL